MTISEDKIKIILSYLYEHNNEITKEVFNGVLNYTISYGYSLDEVKNEIRLMDKEHDGLLNITYPLDPQGNGTVNVGEAFSWLSYDGELFLEKLNQKPKKQHPIINHSFSFIEKILISVIAGVIIATISYYLKLN